MKEKKYVEDTVKIVDKLMRIRPDLQINRLELIESMLEKKPSENIMIFEKLNYNNKIYYRDNKRYIWENILCEELSFCSLNKTSHNNVYKAEIVGIYELIEGNYKYIFFSEILNRLNNIRYHSKDDLREIK